MFELIFVFVLKDTEAIEEDTIELVVETTKPNKTAKWIRNGRNINPNEERFANRYEIVSHGCTHRLVIKNCQIKDAGEFVCIIDELSEKANLVVKECKFAYPQFEFVKIKYIK